MTKKRLLMVCYGFPPIGGGGVPRPLKMAKYLGDFGWDVTVLTVEPGYHATLDHSLLQEVPPSVQIVRAKEWKVFARGGAAAPTPAVQSQEANPAAPSAKARLKKTIIAFLKKVRPYLMIPDDQILWYPQAVKTGQELMKREKFDAIFSTSGPATNHLVAKKLADEFGCKWIADFRDPWTQNMHQTGIEWREALEERLERGVMARADVVTTVTATFVEMFSEKYGDTIKAIKLIYNGFDRSDFADLQPQFEVPDRFHAVYAGILYQKRNPRLLLEAVRELIDEGRVEQSDILFSFAGVFDYPGYTENRDCVERLQLGEQVRLLGNLPHKQALGLMKGGDALLLVGDVSADAGAYIPGKLYEYMGIGKPILALNMAGEATEIIQQFQLGEVCDPTDKAQIKQAYLALYQAWKAQRAQQAAGGVEGATRDDASFYERVKPYERRYQAEQLALELDKLLAMEQRKEPSHV
ncbi:UNVERIFIED_CONTAM: glycosyltransferase involved in cell wall biosynthesis [Brevibacillus sp. OAP136]